MCSRNSRSGGEEREIAWGLVAIQHNQICELQVHWKSFFKIQGDVWGRHLPSASCLHVCIWSAPALSALPLYTCPLYIQKKWIKSISQHGSIMKSKHMGSCPALDSTTALGSMLAQCHTHTLHVITTCNHYSTLLGSGHVPSHSVPTAALWAWPLKTKWSSARPTCHRLSVPRSAYRFSSLAPHMIIIRPRAGETLRQDEPSGKWRQAGSPQHSGPGLVFNKNC